jgi:hypothetical protein
MCIYFNYHTFEALVFLPGFLISYCSAYVEPITCTCIKGHDFMLITIMLLNVMELSYGVIPMTLIVLFMHYLEI